MFHFLLAWEPEYEDETVEQHLRIIEGRGDYEPISRKYVWWGKFAKQLNRDGRVVGPPLDQENLAADVAETVVAEANRRIRARDSKLAVYLFIINPYKGPESLYVARVREVVYAPDHSVPPDDEIGSHNLRPQCAYMCDYYFFKPKDLRKCSACVERDDNCRTRFLCNFFFKIDKLESKSTEWANLELAANNPMYTPRSDGTIRLAVQNYYPTLVQLKEFRDYWPNQGITYAGTIWEVVQQAREIFRENLVFLDSAMKSAANSPYLQPDRVGLLFQTLDELVQSWRKDGRVEGSWKMAFKKYGFDYKPHISQTAEGKYGSEYEFIYKGRHHLFGEHVTLGGGQPDTCMSVHWIRDKKDKRIVIGWCGRHLTNTLT